MKATVNLKYSKGDVVSVNIKNFHYSKYCYGEWASYNIPSNKEYTIDGYRIVFTKGEEPLIQYVFHCYMDKYIGYHDLIPEYCLESVGENHPQEIEINFKDVFDEEINFGDRVYYDLYRKGFDYKKKCDAINPTNMITFVNGGAVEAMYYCNNIWARNGYTIVYNQDFMPSSNGGACYESSTTLCKSVPATLYKDLIDKANDRNLYFDSKYYAPKFKELMEHFGQYDQACEYYDNWKTKRIKSKEYREKRKSQPKAAKNVSLSSLSKDISNLSAEDKAKLLKMLMENEYDK